MALDREDIKFITDQNDRMKTDLMDAITLQGSGTRALIESEVNRIDEMDKVRNGRIRTAERDIETLEQKAENCEAHVKGIKWLTKRWYMILVFMVIFGLCTSWLFHHLDVRKTVEKQIGIELKEDEND